MPTPVDGFRKQLTENLPALHAETTAKVGKLEADLGEQREALAFVERVAAAAQVDLTPKGKKNGEAPEGAQPAKA